MARTGAALTLARAFQDDAMFRYIEPDEDRRRRVLPWFFGAALRLGRHDGRVDELAGSAAAIWLVPGGRRSGRARCSAPGSRRHRSGWACPPSGGSPR